MSTKDFWWTDFFDDTYADVGLVSTAEDAENRKIETAKFIIEILKLNTGDTVLDQCCGIGRLSVPLAKMGLRVIGVDQGPTYAKRAEKTANDQNLPCTFYTADAFEFVAPELCDAAFNWYTSFGYHQDDSLNRKMLDRAFESIKAGGWFALDYVSTPKVLKEFRACHLSRIEREGKELLWIQEPKIDFATGMMKSTWTFIYPDQTREIRKPENRSYMPNELVVLFRQAGFINMRLYGSINGESFDRLSPRCIVVGQKPVS